MPLLVFCLVLAFVPWWPDGAHAPRWVLLSVAVPVLLFTIQRVSWTPGHFCLGGFLLWGLASFWWTPDLLLGADIYWHFLLFGGLFLLAPSAMHPVYVAAGLALCINSLTTVLQVLQVVEWEASTFYSGLFFNKNLSAEVAALAIVGLVVGARPTLCRSSLAIGASVPLLTLPLSRGAILALVSAGWLVLWRRAKFAAALVAVVAIGISAHFLTLKVATLSERLEIWGRAWDGLSLWGNGLGSFRFDHPFFEYAHNDFLQVAYELGLPGVLLLATFFGYCLWRGAIAERLVIVVFLVEGLFAFPLYMPVTLAIVALAAGSLCRARVAVRGVQRVGERRDYAREAAERREASIAAFWKSSGPVPF